MATATLARAPLRSGEVLLHGMIGDPEAGLTSKAVIETIKALGPVKELVIRLNSGGGYVFEGLAIYNFLRQHSARKTVLIDGIAASMASVIAMVGDTVRAPENAMLMIHNPWNIVGGDAEELRRQASQLDTVRDALIQIYAAKTGLSAERLIEMLDAETWLTAAEAKELGFIDEISGSAPQAALQQVDLSMLRSIPQALAAIRGEPPAAAAATIHGARSMHTEASGGEPQAVTNAEPVNAAASLAAEIRSRVRAARLEPEFAASLIAEGLTIEQAKDRIINAIADRDPAPQMTSHVHVGQSYDDPAFQVNAMRDALVARLTGKPMPEQARLYAGMPLLTMAATLLEARGERTKFLSRDKVLMKAMHSTSDFPALLQSSGYRIMMDAYQAAPSPLKLLARQRTAPDFRDITRLKLSEAPQLLEVPEGAEVTHGSRAEAKEAYRLKTFARLFGLSRQAIVNDDLGAFSDWAVAMGRAAAETENDVLVSLLTANSGSGVTMDDGKALYHADHGNKAASGGAISVSTLSAARLAMRQQKGLDGRTPINAQAKFLLVPPELETTAEQTLASIYAAQVSDVNPFSGRLELLVEPRLSGTAWRLFADPAVLPTLEYAHLQDAPGPQFAMQEGWNILGAEFRAVLDFGAGAIEHRGTYMDSGSA